MPIEIDLDDLEAGVPGLTSLWERELLTDTSLRGFEMEPSLPADGDERQAMSATSDEAEQD